MPAKRNPLNLNPLQLKTLTLLQALAACPTPSRAKMRGRRRADQLPDPHGDHFHLGDAVVAARDATGLRNPAVWAALERKGLVKHAVSAIGDPARRRPRLRYRPPATRSCIAPSH